MPQPLRVLVVDDSALMRKTIRRILTDAGGFEVSTARNGVHALEELERETPDVVTLDVNMPEMDGLSCLSEIMKRRPLPVVMVSSLTEQGALVTLEALALGAVDFVAKPGGTVSLNLDTVAGDLIGKVRRAALARVRPGRPLSGGAARQPTTGPARTPAPGRPEPVGTGRAVPPAGTARAPVRTLPRASLVDVVLVGASTGGPPLLSELIGHLPAGFPAPMVIAQHMPASFTGALARRLNNVAAVNVVEVTAPVKLEPGTVYIGRGDADVVIGGSGRELMARSVPSSSTYRWHPSVDRLVSTARAATLSSRLVGVLLTGMGDDGAEQMTALQHDGGRTIAEAEETAVVWGMPGELTRRGGATVVLPGDQVASQLLTWVR